MTENCQDDEDDDDDDENNFHFANISIINDKYKFSKFFLNIQVHININILFEFI